jgi:hypothetical protein
MLAFALSLMVASSPLNLNSQLINPNEIDKIFNNLTPDSMGGKDNSSLIINDISDSSH